MWDAISEIVRTLEQMADGTAAPHVHLASLDPGVGKTQSIIQFLPVLLSSSAHEGVSAIICVGRLKQIEAMIDDARQAGLRDEDFAVFTSGRELNKLGRGTEDRQNARVLFTTHAMVMKQCSDGGAFADATDFHFRHHAREIRVWDEAITPGLAVISDTQIRDGLVQRFAFTYEIAHKMLKRYLEFASPNPALIDGMSLQELIRTASEQGLLLGEWADWRGFREMRSKTSHTYNEDVALEVVGGIPRFIEEACVLYDRLAERLA